VVLGGTMFTNRIDAGQQLSAKLVDKGYRDVVVLGLPRGGVPVAAEVAKVLNAPLDVVVVRKLGIPYQPEVAMGAISEGGLRVLDQRTIAWAGVSAAEVALVERTEQRELAARTLRLRRGRARVSLAGKTVIVVDDGLATGATARVACEEVSQLGAARVVLAVPVGAASVIAGFHNADEVVCVLAAEDLGAIGLYYDEEVEALLGEADRCMRASDATPPVEGPIAQEIRRLAKPLIEPTDLGVLAERIGEARYVGLGEASHGTHEYYYWRGEFSKMLIVEKGFNWIGVEGDWPDCWRINRWVHGEEHREMSAKELLAGFERWPTWMWANAEVAEFLTWLREWNATRASGGQVGFYGLDVYSLWDSLRVVSDWLAVHDPDALPAATKAWACFEPYGEDPQHYAQASRLVPLSCESDVVGLLTKVRENMASGDGRQESIFNAVQNAEVVTGAERYYRAMMRGDRESWNVRDRHMVDTVDRLSAHLGENSKGLIWAHNTHIGDARATDMARAGMVNVGQLLRERHGSAEVALVGMAAYEGSVIAAGSWGEREDVMDVPPARATSHEDLLHQVLGRAAILAFTDRRDGAWLGSLRGHRAIGVVYQPGREVGNYVPTVMGERYDALLWFEQSTALAPLHQEGIPREHEYETAPSGF
jgi:erythromycin esterase